MTIMITILGMAFVIVGILIIAFGDSADSEPVKTVGFIIAIFGVVLDFISAGMAVGFI